MEKEGGCRWAGGEPGQLKELLKERRRTATVAEAVTVAFSVALPHTVGEVGGHSSLDFFLLLLIEDFNKKGVLKLQEFHSIEVLVRN